MEHIKNVSPPFALVLAVPVAHQHDGKHSISGFRTLAHSGRVCRADFGSKTTRFRAGREDHGNQLIPVTADPGLADGATAEIQGRREMRPSAVLPLSPYLSNPYQSSVPAYLAVLPAGADPRIALFFALVQVPLFLSPFALGPIYRRISNRLRPSPASQLPGVAKTQLHAQPR